MYVNLFLYKVKMMVVFFNIYSHLAFPMGRTHCNDLGPLGNTATGYLPTLIVLKFHITLPLSKSWCIIQKLQLRVAGKFEVSSVV